jgi:hypothetical protein
MEYYSTIMENKIMSFSGKWMELKIIRLSEISKTQRDNYHMFLSYVESRPGKMT